jgi:hypothetical protein
LIRPLYNAAPVFAGCCSLGKNQKQRENHG